MSSEFPKRTTPIPSSELRRSKLPVVCTATGRPLPALTNVEIQDLLDQEERAGDVSEQREQKAKNQGTLADFFAASPLRESGLEIERLNKGEPDAED